jgi:hypothetical protein
MIVALCISSNLTKVDWITLCSSLGIECYFNQTHRIIRYDGRTLPVTPVYLTSLSDIKRCLNPLRLSDRRYVVVLGVKHVHLTNEKGDPIPVQRLDLSDVTNLKNLIRSSVDKPPITEVLRLSLSEESIGVARSAMGNSVMHQVQTNLYRIPKAIRTDIQMAVFAYLSGSTPQLGKASQYPHIMTMLSSEEMQNLRRACKALSNLTIEQAVKEYSVDAFDMNFLKAQDKKFSNTQPPLKTRTPKVVRKPKIK